MTVRHLLTIEDLAPPEIEDILTRADHARHGSLEPIPSLVASLVFLSPSTRTRLGFEVAVARLGGTAIGVAELRATGPGLPPETLHDTVRVCSGMSDVVVVRHDGCAELRTLADRARCPMVNGGDALEHPTQALIDRFAIEQLVGPVGELHVGISGDLTVRSTTSLLALLASAPPRRLSLFAAPGRSPMAPLPAALDEVTDRPDRADFSDVDVLLLPGLAPGSGPDRLDDETRQRWGFSPLTAGSLPEGAIVLSPGPIIDEIHPDCIKDPRVRVFDEADLGVYVRMGVLHCLSER